VLSTRTTHWFIERGFVETATGWLPERKAALYNYDRRSKIFVKDI
jgi:amino-acid N-acetyltransferase